MDGKQQLKSLLPTHVSHVMSTFSNVSPGKKKVRDLICTKRELRIFHSECKVSKTKLNGISQGQVILVLLNDS